MSLNFKRLILLTSLSFFFIKPILAEITFQEILENPSDLEMNLKYATEQEELGRYKTTLATLERLTMLKYYSRYAFSRLITRVIEYCMKEMKLELRFSLSWRSQGESNPSLLDENQLS